MAFKKQHFGDWEMALFTQAFMKKLFIRPEVGEMFSMCKGEGCTICFDSEYYEKLSSDIENAHEKGKFSESNASADWQKLRSLFLDAEDLIDINKRGFDDYFQQSSMFWG